MANIGVAKVSQTTADTLVAHAKAANDSFTGVAASKWFITCIPEDVRPTQLEDEKELKKPFDRQELNDGIERMFEDLTKVYRVEMASAQLQTAFVGGVGRDFRWLYRRRLRIMAHQLARSKTHEHPNGMIIQGLLRRVKQVNTQGKDMTV